MPLQSTLQAGGNGLCLLSLDAGGQRAISQLKILAGLMNRLNSETSTNAKSRPCDVFDMIGGAGSGGFIALLLVVLGLTAEQALEEFSKLSTNVLDFQGETSARTTALRGHINDLLKRYQMEDEIFLMDSNSRSNGCKCVVPISYKHHVESKCTLRNFTVRKEPALNVTIAEALLATLATPPLFSPTSIFKDAATFEYVGGDLTLSNPIREIIAEAHACFGPDEQVACLLSVGCGHPGLTPVPNSSSLATWNAFLGKLVADSEREAQNAGAQMGHLELYQRFSVNRGLEVNSLDANASQDRLITSTAVYMDDVSVVERATLCVELLKMREGTASLDQLKRSGGHKVFPPPLPPLTDMFVMRREPWGFIERVILGAHNADESNRRRILVITGMGGCGKTQLIRKFVQVHTDSFSSVFFIDGSSEPRIHADMVHNVRALGTQYSQMTFKECLGFLGQPVVGHPRLIVYDNVDDPELRFLPLLPPSDHCALIVISRNRSLGQLNRQGHLELDAMSKEEAVELLSHPSSSPPLPTERSLKEAHAVAEELCYLPIALTQARSYMFQTKCSASAYLERFMSSRDRLLAQTVEYQRDMRYTSTYAAFDASFQVLPDRDQRLIRLLSFFHWAKFPLELVILAAKHDFSSHQRRFVKQGADFHAAKELLQDIFHRNGKFEVIDLEQMTISLQRYSLMMLSSGIDTNLVQMHPLIHSWVNSSVSEQDRPKYLSATFLLLALGQRNKYTPSAKYLPSHVVHLAPLWDQLPLNNAAAFGSILHDAKLYNDALRIREKIVQDLKTETDPSKIPSDVLAKDLQGHLAHTYRSLERFSEAEVLQLEVLKVKREMLGEHHPDTVAALNNLVLTYTDLGRLNEAEVAQAEVVRLSRDSLGESNVGTIAAMANLARIYFRLKRVSEALKLWEEVLRLDKKTLGERHPHAIRTASNLALAYRDLGRHSDAEAPQVEVVKLRREIQGDDHPETVKAMLGLAIIYEALGKYSQARELCSKVEVVILKTLGTAHPQYGRCQRIKLQLQNPRDTPVVAICPASGTSHPTDHSSPATVNEPHAAVTTADPVDSESPQSTRARDKVQRLLSRLRISST